MADLVPPTAAQALPLRPDDVPGVVDVGLLKAILHSGRAPPRAGAVDETLLCVHGLGHDSWDFAPLSRARPNDLSVVAVDLPGFGPARIDDKAPAPITLAILAASIVEQAKQLKRPPVVVASSLGGHAALIAALENPGLFAGLVLLSPGGLVEVPSTLRSVLLNYYSVDAILGRPDDEIVRNSRRIFVRPHPMSDALAVRKLALHRAPRTTKEKFAVPFATVCDDVFKRPVLADVHRLKGLPMTVLFGDGDVVVPLSSGRYLEDRCRAKLHILERCGHCPHLEDIDRTGDIIFAFARDVFANAQH